MSKCFKLLTRAGRICFQIPVWEYKREKQYSFIIDGSDTFVLQPNLKYYENHDFSKAQIL